MRQIRSTGILLAIALMAIAIALTACGSDQPPAPTPTPIPATPTAIPTLTPLPTDTPIPSSTPVPTDERATNAWLSGGQGRVELRDAPGTAGEPLLILQGTAPLTLIGRTENLSWLQARLETNVVGWLPSLHVQTDLDIIALPVTGVAQDLPPTPVPDAMVQTGADGLRLRDQPGSGTNVLDYLDPLTPLAVVGRTFDGQWLQVQTPQALTGWISILFVDLYISLDDVPVTGVALVVQPTATSAPLPPYQLPDRWQGAITGISDNARRIFRRGQSLGNRADVFSKVGDSITVAGQMYTPIGHGSYTLADYGFLQPVIAYYSVANARDGNSFANVSIAADNGWNTGSLLDPELANNPVFWDPQCGPNETPLRCEYRVVKPAIALIMLGTNDVVQLPVEVYRANLERIVQISIDRGVIPVLSTIPERPGSDVGPYNAAVRSIASAHDIPLWDYWSVMADAPNQGISHDNIHPSEAPGDHSASADFNQGNLGYGYNLRNLTALMVLDALWRQVIRGS